MQPATVSFVACTASCRSAFLSAGEVIVSRIHLRGTEQGIQLFHTIKICCYRSRGVRVTSSRKKLTALLFFFGSEVVANVTFHFSFEACRYYYLKESNYAFVVQPFQLHVLASPTVYVLETAGTLVQRYIDWTCPLRMDFGGSDLDAYKSSELSVERFKAMNATVCAYSCTLIRAVPDGLV